MSTPHLLQSPPPGNPYQSWLARLRRLELPITEASRKRVLDKLASPSANARNMAQLLGADPVLSLSALALANHHLRKTDNRCGSLEHAVSLLGMPRLQALVEHLPSVETGAAWYPGFRQALITSQHAAWQLRCWTRGNPRWDADSLALEALLAGAPLWMLWFRGDQTMPRLLRARAEGRVGVAVQREIFGCPLQPLLAALCKSWLLPLHSQQAWQRAYSGSNRQWLALLRNPQDPGLQSLRQHPSLLIALANAVAEAADWHWDSRHTRKLLAVTAAALDRDLDSFSSEVHRNAAQFSRQCEPGGLAPAAALLGHYQRAFEFRPRARRKAPAPAPAPAPAVPAAPAATSATALTTPPAPAAVDPDLAQALAALRDPERFDTPHGVLNFLVDTLVDALGFRRALALAVKPAERSLRCLAQRGCDAAPELARFQGSYLATDLFGKLLVKPAGLHIHADNRAQYWPLLPGSFKLVSQAPSLVLMSLFRGEKPLALVCADQVPGAGVISSKEYSRFKQLCSAANQRLSMLGN